MQVGFYDLVKKFNPNHDKKGRFTSSGGSAYEIKSETTDYTGNELYARSAAYKDGKEVGYVEYSKPDGMPPYVQYIHVNEDQRGNGIARKLLQDLQRQYPDEEIDFGYTTSDGAELLKRVLKPVVDKDLKAKFDSLEDKRKQLEHEEKAMDELFEKIGDREATAQEREKLSDHGDRWEALDGEIRQLSEELRGKKHTKMMVDMTDGVNKSFSSVLQKFNPNHDKLGRFAATGSASDGGNGTTYKLFHGSPNANIDQFDISHSGENTQSGENLLFFTDSREFADAFSYERLPGTTMVTNRKGEKGRVYEVDVTMKKPLDFRNLSDADVNNILKLSDDDTLTADEVRRLADRNHQLLKTYIDLQSGALKELGYDGLIADTKRGALEYAVVSNDQVKITKMTSRSFVDVIRKYNSVHDKLGRFASGHGALLQADKGSNSVKGKNDVKNKKSVARREKADILEIVKEYSIRIPEGKIVKYALNMDGDDDARNKAIAFQKRLGYNMTNWKELYQKVEKGIYEFDLCFSSTSEWGNRYFCDMHISGPNGKMEFVRTAWLADTKTNEFRMTSVYIKD